MKNTNRLTSATTPAILKVFGTGGSAEWKVSPYGPYRPDKNSTWCDSRADAEREATLGVVEPRTILTELNRELDGLRSYLLSDKFREDPTVQVADVLTRLEQLRHASERAGEEEARRIVDGPEAA